MVKNLPAMHTRGSLSSLLYLVRNLILAPQLEKTHEMPPSWRDEGLFHCMARKTIPSHLSKLHRRLHSLYATQWAPRDTRRDSTGERSPFFPLKTRPDSPGESRMQPCKVLHNFLKQMVLS